MGTYLDSIIKKSRDSCLRYKTHKQWISNRQIIKSLGVGELNINGERVEKHEMGWETKQMDVG